MTILAGTRLGVYEVIGSLGSGGMGEVYRARDTRLDRDVAIKVLPESFTQDPDRVMRFTREAKTLAALNHPNIAHIYGTEESSAGPALVMELVEGEDLAVRLSRGAVPIADALPVARQLVDALEAAHEHGVIHRDLKPANIKIRPDGTAKILDFGLAKALTPDGADQPSGADQPRSVLPTMTSPAITAMGVILGTASYMSPEQARGYTVDRRADIWAFGVILFEMLTGQRVFAGESMTDVIAAVVKEEPAWSTLPSDTPAAVRRLLRRCLQKNPRRRLRDAADARLDLDDAIAGVEDATASARADAESGGRRGAWILGAAAVVVAAIAGAAGGQFLTRPRTSNLPLRRFEILTPDRRLAIEAVVSPDGRAVAFMTAERAWVQHFDQQDPLEIPGAGGGHTLFWSPDSKEVGYQARGRIWRAAVGGAPVDLGATDREFSQAAGAAWMTGDRIWYTTGGSGLLEISARGGTPRRILDADQTKELDFHEVSALPDRESVLFAPHLIGTTKTAIDLFDGKQRTRVYQSEENIRQPVYSPTGHLLFQRPPGVWALKFSLATRKVEGEPFLVARDGARPSVSVDGTLVMVPAGSSGDLQLAWVTRSGLAGTIGRAGIPVRGPRLSPDGRYVVASIGGRNAPDLYVFDVKTGTDRRLTFEEDADTAAVWSPDGRFIIYQCGAAICSRSADGSSGRVVLVPEPAAQPAVSPDGKYLLFSRQQAVTGADIFLARMGPAGFGAAPVEPPRPFLPLPAIQRAVEVSPDGTLAAYESRETGEDEIYLTTFPAGVGKWQVSRTTGLIPRWSRTGDRLFFVSGDRIIETPIVRTPSPAPGESTTLVTAAALGVRLGAFAFDRSLDGSKLLVVRQSSGQSDVGTIWIVEQWAKIKG